MFFISGLFWESLNPVGVTLCYIALSYLYDCVIPAYLFTVKQAALWLKSLLS